MNSQSAPKRCRASAEQLNYMVDFMTECKGLAGGRFQKMHGKLETQKKCPELTETLNSLGGAVKSVEQWHNVWRDLKSRTSNKVRDRKKQQALTGNKPLTIDPMTEMEKRIISLIGQEYVEGSGIVAENVPETELLAESNAANTKAIEIMAKAIQTMGEGLKHVSDSFNNLAHSINKI